MAYWSGSRRPQERRELAGIADDVPMPKIRSAVLFWRRSPLTSVDTCSLPASLTSSAVTSQGLSGRNVAALPLVHCPPRSI
jgi:hypothetical protein